MKRVPWWVWAGVVLPFGAGGWAPIVPGVERRKPVWILLGVLSLAFLTLAIVLDPVTDDALSGFFIIFAWITSAATVIGIRKPYLAGVDSGWDTSMAQAKVRLEERREALALCASNPALAMELGVGRPDLPNARHAGLVDVNHASWTAISALPGMTADDAKRTVRIRDEVNGFSSLADFGSVLDLDGNAVERMRDRAVFLPR